MSSDSAKTTLWNVFEQAAGTRKASILFGDETEGFSGSESRLAVEQVAAGLTRLGVGRGDRVAFLTTGSARHAIVYFACQRIGAVPCALHVREPASRVAESLRWLEAAAIWCDAPRAELAADAAARSGLSVPRIGFEPGSTDSLDASFDDLIRDGSPHVDLPPPPGPDDLGMIVMSSGSTGAPKGTMNVQRTLRETARAGRDVFGGIKPRHAVLVAVAPSAAAWIHIVLPFLAGGAAIQFVSTFEPRAYVERIGRDFITHAPIVPTMWRMVLAAIEPEDDVSTLEMAFYAGEVGDSDLVSAFKRILPKAAIRTGYLSAEGGCASACVADERTLIDAAKPSSTGRPIAGCELRIVAPDGTIDDVVAPGAEGEIVLKSASIGIGYWKDADLTARRFVDGWWRSGDVGRVDEAGDLFILGRTDNVINSGGLKLHAEEVEAALLEHPSVSLAAVVSEPDERWGRVAVAHVVTSHNVNAEEILSFVRDSELLANYKVPKRIYFHDTLPTGPTGKLDRRALVG